MYWSETWDTATENILKGEYNKTNKRKKTTEFGEEKLSISYQFFFKYLTMSKKLSVHEKNPFWPV